MDLNCGNGETIEIKSRRCKYGEGEGAILVI